MNPQPSPAPILTSFQRAQVNGSVHEAGAPSGITGRLPTARTQRSRSRITDGIPPLFRCARTRQVTPQNLGIRPRDPLCSNSVKHSMQVSVMTLTIAHVTTRRNIQHKNAPKQPPRDSLYIQAKTTQPAEPQVKGLKRAKSVKWKYVHKKVPDLYAHLTPMPSGGCVRRERGLPPPSHHVCDHLPYPVG